MATTVSMAAAQQYGENQTIKIWDNSSAPHSNHLTGEEGQGNYQTITNITSAELYVFYPPQNVAATGQAVLICPGGGYQVVAVEHEGVQVAMWLAQNGVTAAVLKYRMPNGVNEIPMEDAVEALRVLRGLADEHNFSAQKVGVMGFSAGGHLAASLSNLVEDSVKPNFSVLFYPVITHSRSLAHQGTFNSLLGSSPEDELVEKYSIDKQVTSSTPPAFIALSDDDTVVNSMNSISYYEALKEVGVSASLHIYPSGGHGWGMNDSFSYASEWRAALLDWLTTL